MKRILFFGVLTAAGCALLGTGQSCPASVPLEAKAPEAAPMPERGLLFWTWGWFQAHECKLTGSEVSARELPLFLKGFTNAFLGRPAPCDVRQASPDIERLAHGRRERFLGAMIRENEATAKRFFAALHGHPNVVALAGGGCFEPLLPGRGPHARPQQTLLVHYTGRLLDGTEFVQMGPLEMVLVTNRSVCRGWYEAAQRVSAGGSFKLYVPPPLSEKEAGAWGIEPGSAMVFEAEVRAIQETTAEALAESQVPAPPVPAEPAPLGLPQAVLLEGWGWTAAQQTRATRLRFRPEELEPFVQGLVAGMQDAPPRGDLRQTGPAVESFVAQRRQEVRAAFLCEQRAAAEAFFAGLKTNSHVARTASGLCYEVLQAGTGAQPRPGQWARMRYVSRLLNGTVYDRTQEEEPLEYEVGKTVPGWIPRGWDEGVRLMSCGEKIRLYIPPELGFGEQTVSGEVSTAPPGSTLIVELELLAVREGEPPVAPGPPVLEKH